MHQALHDITVLEVGVMTPGKYCGFLLTGWGARSIRIERAAAGADEGISEEDLLLNRGKQSIALNLKEPGGSSGLPDAGRNRGRADRKLPPGCRRAAGHRL